MQQKPLSKIFHLQSGFGILKNGKLICGFSCILRHLFSKSVILVSNILHKVAHLNLSVECESAECQKLENILSIPKILKSASNRVDQTKKELPWQLCTKSDIPSTVDGASIYVILSLSPLPLKRAEVTSATRVKPLNYQKADKVVYMSDQHGLIFICRLK